MSVKFTERISNITKPSRLSTALHVRWSGWQDHRQLKRMALAVRRLATPDHAARPVLFFNASTRVTGLSQNAAYSLLTAWALRLQQVPVVHFVCQSGMPRCVLGTSREDYLQPPPCRSCMAQSRAAYAGATTAPFGYHEDPQLAAMLEGLNLDELMKIEHPLPVQAGKSSAQPAILPLGQLVLPSLRWALRRHTLPDDEPTCFLYRQYLLSAANVAREFSACLDRYDPQAVIVFNGQFFPEATARWLALERGLPAITHEVGLQPFSAFFTTGEATAYPLEMPDDFILSPAQDARLDAYLSRRFQGNFSMAGIKFWPTIQGLDQAFRQRAAAFKQIVPVFTNVIFDTSQPHSNVVFDHMFSWLDLVLELIRGHPETLFVIRAHPDEGRPGKASHESVRQWVERNQAEALPNLFFVDFNQSLSSYELIECSKFVMVYNSTIGLEASIMGAPVLCAGRARFTQLPTVYFPSTPQEFRRQAEEFLSVARITVPPEFKRNARRFLYYQLYRSSLPFGEFVLPANLPGFVKMREFDPGRFTPANSLAIHVLTEGILHGKPFLLENDPPVDLPGQPG